ncbi:hypothetical protein [Burkholderia multivorans]|uniref:hypothetical protein n=1 Tax=Burkholderia multivorans TaxID=87883 RepID=UPI0012DD9B83|nr:hypothetical protein [Burkholderia multivorans]MBU9152334.1 hypothetical protein [Burkholderia multivorans]MCA8337471.1 hypothetical protein [Burkholderia multivorans]MDN8011142.1 hypothetical protein [Burkholderia multivorans]QGR87257.1 hypothetical protein FOC34_18750 [Burkholderia multivorans]UXZ61592.1 hypothetical protein NUJ28_02415 [Burkholderia multivorans]
MESIAMHGDFSTSYFEWRQCCAAQHLVWLKIFVSLFGISAFIGRKVYGTVYRRSIWAAKSADPSPGRPPRISEATGGYFKGRART